MDEATGLDTRRHFRAYTVFVIMFMSMGSVTFGYAAAIIGTTLGQPSFYVHMGLNTAPNAKALIGAMNALYFTGGVFGSFCHGWLANAYGRKISIAAGSALVVISGALLTASVNPTMFIIFRFTSGWGSFQLLATVPLWVTEIVPPQHRGMLADIHAVGLNVGYTVAGYVGLGFYFTKGPNAWRPPMALSVVAPLILLLGIYWMPESPRWLLSKDREEEAWTTVRRLHSAASDTDDAYARREFYQMRLQIEFERNAKATYVEIFRRPSFRKRALITMFLTFSLFSSGTLVINNYGTLIYKNLGYNATDTLLFQTGWTACALVFNILAMSIVDKVPRNRLISFGFFMVMCTLIAEAAIQKNFLGTTNKGGLGAAAAMLYLFIICYSLFLDGPCYFYIAELWPTHLRAQGYTLGIGVLALTNVIWLQAAPTAFASIGWTFYIFFIVFAGIGFGVSLFFFPNTLHKPLEEIAAMFGDDDLVVIYQKDIEEKDMNFEGANTSMSEKVQVPTSQEEEDIERSAGRA